MVTTATSPPVKAYLALGPKAVGTAYLTAPPIKLRVYRTDAVKPPSTIIECPVT